MLLHTRGAKSGIARLTPLMSIPWHGDRIIVASKGGAPEHPAWYFNVVTHPEVSIDVGDGDGGLETVDVLATELTGGDYDAAWAAVVGRAPGFSSYRERTDRVIPLLRLVRR